jgi:hypothetical protein
MNRTRVWLVCALVAATGLTGCVARKPAAEELGTDESVLPASIPGSATPLDLREFEVVDSEGGYRGVFLKLSRLPSAVTHSSANEPARVEIDIQGPTGTQSAEEVFPAGDTLITRMRVSRDPGLLRVVLDLEGDRVPEYAVYPMADWIMIRFKLERQERPWAHRAS